jgi:hypothetical protein
LSNFEVDDATMVTEFKEAKANYLQAELKSLGIQPKGRNELNDKEELEALATAIKEVYFQDYKTAYNVSGIEIDQSHFDHLI